MHRLEARMKSRFAFLLSLLLPVAAFFGLAFAVTSAGWLARLENLTVDKRVVLRRYIEPAAPPEDLAIVGIDERSLKDLGRWPWPWTQHGDFMQLLGRKLPSVVAWDILFTDADIESQGAVSPHEYMAKSIDASGAAVVLAAMRSDKGLGMLPSDPKLAGMRFTPLTKVTGNRSRIPSAEAMSTPVGRLAQVADIGFVDTPPDVDGVTRVLPLVVRIGDTIFPTLSLRSLMLHWGMTPEQVEVRLGEALIMDNGGTKRRVPIDASGGYFVNYRYFIEDEQSNIDAHGYSHLTKRLHQQQVEKKNVMVPDVTGKILLVGQTADALADFGPTPFAPRTPLVLVHANAIANLLAEDYVRATQGEWAWLALALLGLIGLARFSERQLWEQAVFSLGIPVAYGAIVTALWIQGTWLLPVVGPLLGFGSLQVFMIGRRVLQEQRAKEQVRGMFSSYLAPEVVKRMIDSGEMPRLGGHQEEITAYFSDIQGFSTFSEQMPPDRLVELMNEYLTACTDIIQEEGGTLDKYIGDAIVTMFGAPLKLPDHAYRACVATQRVHARLAELREKWRREGNKWPRIVTEMQSRIGLNTGPCIIGNMGSRTRFSYTMMGDNVNIAARMESTSREWGAYTMCTEATKLACEEQGGDRVVFRPLGKIVVKGRSQALPIYEIVGLKESLAPSTAECIRIFSEGLARYYARDWAGATAQFQRSAALEPNIPGHTPGVLSNPSLTYLEIVEDLRTRQLPPEWDGVVGRNEKSTVSGGRHVVESAPPFRSVFNSEGKGGPGGP